MIKKFTLITMVMLTAFFSFAQKGTAVNVSVSADLNCNGIIDANETNVPSFSARFVGVDYDATQSSNGSGLVSFANVFAGSGTVTVTLQHNGQTYTASRTIEVQAYQQNSVALQVQIKCEKPAQTGGINVSVRSDLNCDKMYTTNETSGLRYDVELFQNGNRLQRQSYRTGITSFSRLKEGMYKVAATITVGGVPYTKDLSVNVSGGSTTNAVLDFVVPCPEKPADTVPKVEKPKCGSWYNSNIGINNYTLINGSVDIRNPQVIIARLKANFLFKLDYSIKYMNGKNEVKEQCDIKYTVVTPDGRKNEYNQEFGLYINQPGNYIISYTVNCNGNICETGIKQIRCDEQIVCNCGTPNGNIVFDQRGKVKQKKTIFEGDSVVYNPNYRLYLGKIVNCEGNICDGYAKYSITDANGRQVAYGNMNDRFAPNLPIGNNYTLTVTDICGSKTCKSYNYKLAVVATKARGEGRARLAIQADVHVNAPKLDSLQNAKITPNLMIGLLLDIPLGAAQKIHLWPALNYQGYRFSGNTDARTSTPDVKVLYSTRNIELSLDLSAEVWRREQKAVHIYTGVALDVMRTRKENITGSFAPTWIARNNSSFDNTTIGKFQLGLLYEINKKWMVGANYYSHGIFSYDNRKRMMLEGANAGGALRVAYFLGGGKVSVKK
jgi:hypothetical protein